MPSTETVIPKTTVAELSVATTCTGELTIELADGEQMCNPGLVVATQGETVKLTLLENRPVGSHSFTVMW